MTPSDASRIPNHSLPNDTDNADMGNVFSKVAEIARFISKPFCHSDPEDANPTQAEGSPGGTILQDDAESAALLAPVRDSLDRLERTTGTSMPPPHRDVKTKRHLQVVRDRLVPIGKHIVKTMRGISNRGETELKVW